MADWLGQVVWYSIASWSEGGDASNQEAVGMVFEVDGIEVDGLEYHTDCFYVYRYIMYICIYIYIYMYIHTVGMIFKVDGIEVDELEYHTDCFYVYIYLYNIYIYIYIYIYIFTYIQSVWYSIPSTSKSDWLAPGGARGQEGRE